MSAWTTNDIKELTTYYTKGFPIKEIAKILKRTPTALHKAIARFKLHPLRPKRDQIFFSENGLPIPPVKQRKHLDYFKKLFTTCFNEQWVTFEEVKEFLKKHNIFISDSTYPQKKVESFFSMNKRIVTKAQILLKANQIRIEEKFPPFKIQDVSF